MAIASTRRLSGAVSGRAGAPALHKQRFVAVRAVSDNRLAKKPELRKPEAPQKLFDDAEAAGAGADTVLASSAGTAVADNTATSGVSIEWQRTRAKEMRKYFQDAKMQEAVRKSRVFGFTHKNEIINARWVMFGFTVGMLTEYATGVDFVHQLRLMVTYLGIADLD